MAAPRLVSISFGTTPARAGEVVGSALKPEASEIVEQGEGSDRMLPCSYITHH